VEDSTGSDLEPSGERYNELVLLSKKANMIYIHITQDNLILSLLLCVFLFLQTQNNKHCL